jgi:hypothetical protein
LSAIKSIRESFSNRPSFLNLIKDIKKRASALGFSVLGIPNNGLKLIGERLKNCVNAILGHLEFRNGKYLKMGLLSASYGS